MRNSLDIKLALRITVVPVNLGHLIRIDTTFSAVQLLDTVEEASHDFKVALSLSERLNRFLSPLNPSAGVGNGAFFFVDQGCRQHVDGGIDLCRIHTGGFPEAGGFCFEPISYEHPIEVGHHFAAILSVRFRMGRVHTPNQITLDLLILHVVESRDRGVIVFERALREQIVAVVVFRSRIVTVPFFQHGYHELWFVHVVAGAVSFLREVSAKCRMILLDRPCQIARGEVHCGADVCGALNIRLTAERIDTAASNTDVAKK